MTTETGWLAEKSEAWQKTQSRPLRNLTAAAATDIYSEAKFDGRVMSQAEFIAYCRELRAEDKLLPVQYVIVHHSATSESSYASQTLAQILRNWWNYYRRTKGWSGGPHGVIMSREPGIGLLNSLLYDGVHCAGGNTNTRGGEIMGNFTSVLPSGHLLDNAVVFFAGVLYAGKMQIGALKYHRMYGGTACPGNKLVANWEWFKGLVGAKLDEIAAGDQPPEPPDPTLEERVTELEGQVAALDESLSMVEERVAALEGAVANLAAWQTSADSRIASLESWKGEHEPDGK